MTACYRVERGYIDVPDHSQIGDQRAADAMGPGFGGRRTSHLRRYRLGDLLPADALSPAEFGRLVAAGVLKVVVS